MGGKSANKNFDYNLIKVLDAVISAGSASKASKRLSVTPAAVSLALTRLQSFYEEELFVRGKDGLIPTAKALEIHNAFRQAMELVSGTFIPEKKNGQGRKITILGSEIAENYYLSQLYDDDIFERFSLHHFSARNMDKKEIHERLIVGDCDLIINPDPVVDPNAEYRVIDSFKSFVCICSTDHIYSELSQLTLHNFYSARHAVYQSGVFSPMMINDSDLHPEDADYKGVREKGYRSDSISGIISIIERTSLIALIPLKLALFYKNQRRYAIKMLQPPPELSFKPLNIYASWHKKSAKRSEIEELVTMLQTLSSFRRQSDRL
ncbi:LysR family transcriptional regulator [Superficieibacter sp.]|uniref:LysR family transcriptional regulator n=1 Tax=Superficieibacter sp. TaxID=2303322 RepID=UPI0028AA4883|nr:LysR family transcriptional regulator [Superficieibacter sp.]